MIAFRFWIPRAVAVCLSLAFLTDGVPAAEKSKDTGPVAKIEDVGVANVWTRAARRGENAYVFMTIRNGADAAVRLNGAETEVADSARIVRFMVQGPMLRTALVNRLAVDANEDFTLEPGVVALELRNLKADLKEGGALPVTLVFDDLGTVETTVEIDSRTAVRYADPAPKSKAGKPAH